MASLCLPVPPSICRLNSAPILSTTSTSSPIVSLLPSRFAGRVASTRSSSNSRDEGRRPRPSFCIRAGIRAIETYDSSFQLQPEAESTLRRALSSEVFCAQVAEQSGKGSDVKFEFTGELFQPVPWSPTTQFGMPSEFERLLHDKENFAVINVPPNFMFNAKIFKPSRLCAIYKRVQDSTSF